MAGVNDELIAITARHAAIVLKNYRFLSQTLQVQCMFWGQQNVVKEGVGIWHVMHTIEFATWNT